MNKKRLGKMMNEILRESGEEGVNFSCALNGYGPNWDQVRETLSRWEDKEKIVCIEKRNPINLGLYVSTKYDMRDRI